MYCRQCGRQTEDGICPFCGASVAAPKTEQALQSAAPQPQQAAETPPDDMPSEPYVYPLRQTEARRGQSGLGVAGFVLSIISFFAAVQFSAVSGNVSALNRVFTCVLCILAFLLSLIGLLLGDRRGKHIGLSIAGLSISISCMLLLQSASLL